MNRAAPTSERARPAPVCAVEHGALSGNRFDQVGMGREGGRRKQN